MKLRTQRVAIIATLLLGARSPSRPQGVKLWYSHAEIKNSFHCAE